VAQAARIRQGARKKERLEARISPDQKRLIERAAMLRGPTVTDFIVASAQKAAVETIRDHESMKLHRDARDLFVDAVLNPPAPNEKARAAARRYGRRLGA